MLKRKPSRELDGAPHVSVFCDDPVTRRQPKRLFRSKHYNKHSWQPEKERAMTELLDFILQHEDAFKK
jgi:charged multivesicular body protein 7